MIKVIPVNGAVKGLFKFEGHNILWLIMSFEKLIINKFTFHILGEICFG